VTLSELNTYPAGFSKRCYFYAKIYDITIQETTFFSFFDSVKLEFDLVVNVVS
jgi:hypothetical protein